MRCLKPKSIDSSRITAYVIPREDSWQAPGSNQQEECTRAALAMARHAYRFCEAKHEWPNGGFRALEHWRDSPRFPKEFPK
eukprot:6193936-Pleurochrysis_carterae.AAC.3